MEKDFGLTKVKPWDVLGNYYHGRKIELYRIGKWVPGKKGNHVLPPASIRAFSPWGTRGLRDDD
ncbi:MAG: hypothetical protein RRA15_02225 [bacterium]|nr:hypothetical protein [bacterium]MDT8365297.1 hypothetical protein [bacterium]